MILSDAPEPSAPPPSPRAGAIFSKPLPDLAQKDLVDNAVLNPATIEGTFLPLFMLCASFHLPHHAPVLVASFLSSLPLGIHVEMVQGTVV